MESMESLFLDRRDAGRQLAQRLMHYRDRADLLVLGLPRGGVPVAFEVAQALHAPLDCFLVRKLGVPGHEELAFGAIATGGVRVLNHEVMELYRLSQDTIARVAAREEQELGRRQRAYRGDRPPPALEGRTAIVVDDGLATGATVLAAVQAIKQQRASRVVAAVPVGAPESCADLQTHADEVVCAFAPPYFMAVGLWYRHFGEVSDQEVRELLEAGREAPRGTSAGAAPPRR